MLAQQSPAPETAESPLPKSTCGKWRGWGRAGSSMSAPGSCLNSMHQHLGLHQLIVSRWCLSSELVFKAFKVTFIKFPWGRNEYVFHVGRAQWQTLGLLQCCQLLCKTGSLGKMVWVLLTHQHFIPWCVGKEGHWFVPHSPTLAERRYVYALFSSSSWAMAELSTL